MINLQFTIKNVYGHELLYPANEAAQVACTLLQKRTVTTRDIKLLKRLGHSVEVIAVTLPKWVQEAINA